MFDGWILILINHFYGTEHYSSQPSYLPAGMQDLETVELEKNPN
jgi:hypothetical protein